MPFRRGFEKSDHKALYCRPNSENRRPVLDDPDKTDQTKLVIRGWIFVAAMVLGLFVVSYVVEA